MAVTPSPTSFLCTEDMNLKKWVIKMREFQFTANRNQARVNSEFVCGHLFLWSYIVLIFRSLFLLLDSFGEKKLYIIYSQTAYLALCVQPPTKNMFSFTFLLKLMLCCSFRTFLFLFMVSEGGINTEMEELSLNRGIKYISYIVYQLY